jgi:ketosteroid isomerase-like protein
VPQGNVELVRGIYESFNSRDWDAAFDALNQDFVMETERAGSFRGRDEARRFFEEQAAPFESLTAEPEETFHAEDRVATFVRIRARPAGSTAEIEIRIGHLWEIRDGAAISLRTFPERQRALEALSD